MIGLYLAPVLIVYIFVVVSPIFAAIYYSTFKWPGGRIMTPIGLQNYVDLLKDSVFWGVFKNNIYLTIFCLIGQIGLAFLFACLLNVRGMRLKGFHRTVAYFPVTLSAIVVGFVWFAIYHYNYGILNFLLTKIGKTDLIKVWLQDIKVIMAVVSVPLVWQYIGLYLVIILSAMTSISPEVFEMAEIDGAGGFRKAIFITLPLIRGTLITCVMLCIAGNMRAFEHIFAMTRGGPGYSSSVMALYAYNISFNQMNMGYGTSLSVGILIISMTLVAVSRVTLTWLSRKGEV